METLEEWIKSEEDLGKRHLTLTIFNTEYVDEPSKRVNEIQYSESIVFNRNTTLKHCRRLIQQVSSLLTHSKLKLQLHTLHGDYIFVLPNGEVRDREGKKIK